MVREKLHKLFSEYGTGRMPIVLPKDVFIRENFPFLLHNLGLNKCVEIGVHYGKFAKILCENHPAIEYVGVDSWETDDPVSKEFGQERQNKFMRKAFEKVKPYNGSFLKMKSAEASACFKDQSLDFVFIDGAHDYDHAREDLDLWGPKVKPDGIVAGHDYCVEKGEGVIRAVNEYVEEYEIEEWYITKGRNPSFFWANPYWRQ